jgi:hypothetical protein
MENVEASVIADEGILFCRIGFSRIGDHVDVEVAFVPFLDFIVRKKLPPRGDTFFCRTR